MPEEPELRRYTCPSCGHAEMLDARYIQWCVACGHGADPRPPRLSKRAARSALRERERSLWLFESLCEARNLRPTSAARVGVTVISTLIHLLGLAVLVLPIGWVVATGGRLFWAYAALLVGALMFWTVSPRITFRNSRGEEGLGRDEAPNLYALLDRCVAELGCAVPTKVYVGRRFSASTSRVAMRRTTYLMLGVPLWTVLSGQERIALLGHELGHQVNGDPTHGIWASSARRSLFAWMELFDPRQSAAEAYGGRRHWYRGGHGGFNTGLASLAQGVLFLPFFLVAWGLSTILLRLDLYCGQRAEYLADELGARVAGSEAAEGLFRRLLLAQTVGNFLTAARGTRGSASRRPDAGHDLWARLRRFADSVPETELLRQRVVDEARNTRTDRTHPATHLRAALLRRRPPLAGTIKLSDDEWALIDAELAPAARAVARRLTGS
jgi:hypothetical protein